MPLPDNWTKVTVTHQDLTAGGAPMKGTVTWTPSVPVTNPSAGVTVLAAQRARLDDDGRWSVTVPVVDDPQATPVGWHYEVMFDLREPSGRGVVSTHLVQVTGSMAPSVDWSALVEVSPVGEVSPYLRRVDVGTTAGTVAAGDDSRIVGALPASTAATVVSQQMLTPEQFGAAGNGVTDDTAALVAWLAAGNTGIALRPGRKYLTSVPLTLPGTVKTLAGNGATIAATNDSGSPILAKTSTAERVDLRISDLTLDCASHMDGPKFVAISRSVLSGVTVLNPILTGLTIGDATGPKSNGNRLYDVRVEFAVQPASSVGLLLAKANDTHIVSLEVIGAYTGVLVDSQSSGGIFVAPHVWGLAANLPHTCYDISGATTMFHPHADTPSAFGYRFRANSPHRLVEPEIFVNPSYGNDNTVIAFMLDDFVNISITGPQFIGGDATHRIAADISGPLEFVKASNPYYFQTVIQRLVPTPLRRVWQPEYSGYKGWTFDPAGAGSTGSIPAQGTMQVIRLPWQPGEKITSVYTAVVTAGSGLTANQCLLGVYDMSGNKLGTTVNAATTWQSTGVRQHDLTTPARCNDPYVDVAFHWNGTTGPSLLRGNTGGYAGNGRYATADTGLTTALPATMGTRATGFTSWWVAVS